ncbi:MAG: type I DNA topoisomerase [Flavobacteriales bacterium TMED191]|nr:MAG: type I DNA topoisomerase [Flavobacteriales bacterium TMED191]
MMQNLVIVESPAKANTIEKILGKNFKVVSSYGHIRDLAKKNMGIDIENSFTPFYEVSPDKKKILSSLIKESKKSQIIWLATDEDREGEAIAWHLFEAMNLEKKQVNRIVFNEITKSAIQTAITKPRSINQDLVNAQQARRVLDRIVGFRLSPILWKKVKTGLSAGRVQSVAVRLIVDKEKSIKSFVSSSQYILSANFSTSDNSTLPAMMVGSVKTKKDAISLLESFKGQHFTVSDIEKKPSKSSSSAPFTTSSLQQVASNRLGFSVSRTMSVAQKLYESGHITYMRTDSTNLSKDAVSSIQNFVTEKYGDEYFNVKKYVTKTKVAQEAHEAIRPTNFYKLDGGIDDAQKKLYKLIWERAICSQMSDAIFDKTTVSISASNSEAIFQAKGQIVKFDGYLRLQQFVMSSSQKNIILPEVKKFDSLKPQVISAKEKFSKSPSRYTEASLVKKLEELGIGRPSTYAPTISVIQKREYVLKDDVEGKLVKSNLITLENDFLKNEENDELIGSEKKKLIPTEIGKITNDFLVNNFTDILDYNFTAKVEDEFDNVATGKKDWKVVIEGFYKQFDPQAVSVDKNSEKVTGIRNLGIDPVTKKNVFVRLGKYGPIVQLGEVNNESDPKPKYAKLRKGQTIDSIDLESALDLFSLPRNLGQYDAKEIIVSEGRYGPYIRYENKFISLKNHDPLTVVQSVCIDLIKEHQEFEKKRIINTFNSDSQIIEVLNGKYGPYIKSGKKNFKIPKNQEPNKLTLEDCLNIISQSSKK